MLRFAVPLVVGRENRKNLDVFARWLDLRLLAALIRNTCTFFIVSDKLEVQSKLHNTTLV